MRVISNKALKDFAEVHTQADNLLQSWRQLIESRSFGSFADLKQVFNSVDRVGDFYVFNIGGNKYRLVATIAYSVQVLAVLVTLLSDFIADYEDKHTPRTTVTGRTMLAFLMEQHGLKQADLSEIGSQGVVSELLSGKRELTTKHIKLLAHRFNVPVSVFIE